MYGHDAAELYDLLHAERGKDFAAEARFVRRLIAERNPTASTLLDIACGTGAHLEHLAGSFDRVAGLELSESMLAMAKAKMPEVELHHGDMRTLSLGDTFDAVICLFGSIGYVDSVDELHTTVRRFAEHTSKGGVVVLEPWWQPDTFTPGHISGDVITVDNRTIARVSHASRLPDASHMQVHYVVAEPEGGIRHFTEEHICKLFPRQEYERALEGAGLRVEYFACGLSGKGLYVGTRR
ncbi:class I SAM-dependent methyltransferase [Haloechinothrix sp. LS1_15]|uniref:class I SAM-dependent DNA methyltransferase n=1 Tax=Haloechinothrix sp. LS1_15 TaxID=2652248 RepID=UPI0029482C18|nr:class I SAM-dependent methyltransferase [Haloechinothrix sp. LS1_15]MDV6011628.1 class I SAM-dependent methyltransferase [Haloechinothrix sp. LS1_15]